MASLVLTIANISTTEIADLIRSITGLLWAIGIIWILPRVFSKLLPRLKKIDFSKRILSFFDEEKDDR